MVEYSQKTPESVYSNDQQLLQRLPPIYRDLASNLLKILSEKGATEVDKTTFTSFLKHTINSENIYKSQDLKSIYNIISSPNFEISLMPKVYKAISATKEECNNTILNLFEDLINSSNVDLLRDKNFSNRLISLLSYGNKDLLESSDFSLALSNPKLKEIYSETFSIIENFLKFHPQGISYLVGLLDLVISDKNFDKRLFPSLFLISKQPNISDVNSSLKKLHELTNSNYFVHDKEKAISIIETICIRAGSDTYASLYRLNQIFETPAFYKFALPTIQKTIEKITPDFIPVCLLEFSNRLCWGSKDYHIEKDFKLLDKLNKDYESTDLNVVLISFYILELTRKVFSTDSYNYIKKQIEVLLKNYNEAKNLADKLIKDHKPSYETYVNFCYVLNIIGTEKTTELHQSFGIEYFMRYTKKTLNHLYGNIFNPDSKKPVLYTGFNLHDYNGVFYLGSYEIEKLTKYYTLVISETNSDKALVRNFDILALKHGKSGLFLVAGHGEEGVIQLGEATRYEFNKMSGSPFLDLTDKDLIARFSNFLEEDAKIILASCSTGKNSNSIGALLSSVLKTTAIAPKDPTTFPKLVTDTRGKLTKVKYNVKASIFHSGLMADYN